MGADARLVHANGLRVLEASLTGESEAVLKQAACLQSEAPLAERSNMVFKGTAIAQGSGLGIVTAIGIATEIGAIAQLLDDTPEEVTPLQKKVREIGRMLGIAVLVVASVIVVLAVLDIKGVVTARAHDDQRGQRWRLYAGLLVELGRGLLGSCAQSVEIVDALGD
ncbi:hypothetical protein [Pseudomonas sp. ML2-2023-3]|uniref:P-type ATPase n=1 Tax=Pseudomonas sp. ML2-2023-3 TaxID=3122375 RepID=UPI0030D3B8F7